MFSLLLQTIFTPPVDAVAAAMRPDVILSSSSARKDVARACLRASKARLDAVLAARSDFDGLRLLEGLCFRGEFVGVVSESEDS